ncbi:uncharacterized protein LOC123299632 [Chrysoperla carnea]|uniref:uncharacterized protein LOC123299632 n=1 Tax=Chrysoperla carnea TaxID=189513 RepID=UPI001D05D032|nr:uncharacterized protein LOC123299632 [Chrysoperla carnea]
MRRASITPQSSLGQKEPMIVVEDDEEEGHKSLRSTPRSSQDMDSPMHNPYLLSPWRDPRETRKHSLPTPSCTTGITASQVRRLSERGGEGSGPSPREQAFLATLCSQPAPTSGRRHSVVTISRVPPALFGRNRRESVAAFPSLISKSGSRTILGGSRRESISGGPPPSSDHRGSVHNLQLDIMDDIVTARKVRMKMWNTSSERVCEVQPLDESAGPSTSPMRYTGQTPEKGGRRYSDFVGTNLPPLIPPRRRASEFPNLPTQAEIPKPKKSSTGIVCTNTDLISILSSLTSSATEINLCGLPKSSENNKTTTGGNVEQRRGLLKSNRSNSFDISILHAVNREDVSKDGKITSSQEGPSNWFIKRHQPMSKKDGSERPKPKITFAMDTKPKSIDDKANKVVWDGKSGSVVDAEAIGSAIEVFLRRGAAESPSSPSATTPSTSGTTASSTQSKGAIPKSSSSPKTPSGKNNTIQKTTSPSSWFSGKTGEEEPSETCDTSICSTLKDLFVK